MANANLDVDKLISRVLMVGMVLSMVLMLGGSILLITHHGTGFSTVLQPENALVEFIKMNPQGWLSLGIFTLIITPVARVIAAIFSFGWRKEYKYSVVSVVVFIAMMTGLLLKKVG